MKDQNSRKRSMASNKQTEEEVEEEEEEETVDIINDEICIALNCFQFITMRDR